MSEPRTNSTASSQEGGVLSDVIRRAWEYLQSLPPVPTRIIVHDLQTESMLRKQLPRGEGFDPFALRLEIDPDDAPESGLVYVDYRPSSEWANRRAATDPGAEK